MAKLDAIEFAYGYSKTQTTLEGYDGRVITSWLYVAKPENVLDKETPPSRRYLNILLKGARQAKLDSAYVEALAEQEVYQPTPATLEVRDSLPDLASLPSITVEELRIMEEESTTHTFISCLGFVFKLTEQ